MNTDKDMQELLSQLEDAVKEDITLEKMQTKEYDIVEDEDKIDSLLGNSSQGMSMPDFHWENEIWKSRFYRDEHNYSKAERYMRKMTREFAKYCNTFGLRNDNEKIFFCFDNIFENVYVAQLNQGIKQKVYLYNFFPIVEMYIEYADILFAQQKYDEAKQMLLKAKIWNPVHFETLYKIAEIDKAKGQLEEYLKKTKELFAYAYRLEDIASCYNNLGYYFLEQKLYEVAYTCYTMAQAYNKYDFRASRGKDLILDTYGYDRHIDDSYEKLKEYADEYDFNNGYDGYLEELAMVYGKKYFDEKNYEKAEEFLNIAYDLNGEEEVKKMLDVIEEAQEEDQ